MSGMDVAAVDGTPEPLTFSAGEWEPCYAWRPVRLYMTRRYAWLRPIHRRSVNKAGFETCEYTDDPAAHPVPHPE